MTRGPYTRASGEVDLRYVLRTKVDDYLHANDGFLLWLSLTVGFFGAAVSALVTLAAGVQHPELLYVLLSAFTSFFVGFGIVTIRDGLQARKARKELDQNTRSDLALPLSVTATANAPTVTFTGLETAREMHDHFDTEPGRDADNSANEEQLVPLPPVGPQFQGWTSR